MCAGGQRAAVALAMIGLTKSSHALAARNQCASYPARDRSPSHSGQAYTVTSYPALRRALRADSRAVKLSTCGAIATRGASGNLWMPIGFHLAFDWGETYLYGVPNSGHVLPGHLLSGSSSGAWWLSGGTVGPEGSVLCTLLLIAVCCVCAISAGHQGGASRVDPANPDRWPGPGQAASGAHFIIIGAD